MQISSVANSQQVTTATPRRAPVAAPPTPQQEAMQDTLKTRSFTPALSPNFTANPIANSAPRFASAPLVTSGLASGLKVLAMISPGVVGMVALGETEACFKCGGSGNCQQDWPAGSGLRSNGQKCSSCNGTGECPQCGGTGRWTLVHLPSVAA